MPMVWCPVCLVSVDSVGRRIAKAPSHNIECSASPVSLGAVSNDGNESVAFTISIKQV